ncbi:hypothetical protein [Demequina salsinemoris]|uniref:hypothetical protein n=1 Tax=Demequina salsinemoris TaxID=577470 RepID=UPI000782069D|nr:hypothetical protein [Demequina salsinemoris]
MTDSGAPLSRRERRLRAERAAAAEFDDLATSQTAAIGRDGRPLTRKERRALERAQRPMETWTAEEEMLATGQLPAMTPEAVAAEERNARERAEQAAREAEAASAELRRAAEEPSSEAEPAWSPPAVSAPSPEAATEPESAEAFEPVEPVDAPEGAAEPVAAADEAHGPEAGRAVGEQPPAESAAAEVPAAAAALQWPPMETAAPTASQFEWPVHTSAPSAEEPPTEPMHEPLVGDALVEDYEGVLSAQSGEDADDAARQPFTGLARQWHSPIEESAGPAADVAQPEGDSATPEELSAQQGFEAEPTPAPAAEAEAEAETPTGALPASLLGLFPPGSPQARMMEEGAAHARAQAAAPMQRTPLPPLTPAKGQPATEPAAETAEPVAEPAATDVEPAWAGAEAPGDARGLTPETAALEQALAAAASPAEPSGADAEASAATPDEAPEGAPEAGLSAAGAWASAVALSSDTVGHAARAAGEAVAESRGEPAPHDTELPAEVFGDPAAATITPPAAPHALTATHGDDAPTQAFPPVTAFGTSPARAQGEAPSVWDTHPLMGGSTDFDPDEQLAAGDLPMPDLAALEQAAHPATSTASQGEPAEGLTAEPVTDGIEVPRREVPQLEPNEGARDMRWAQLLVLGAVAFVLGLVAYQVWVRGL